MKRILLSLGVPALCLSWQSLVFSQDKETAPKTKSFLDQPVPFGFPKLKNFAVTPKRSYRVPEDREDGLSVGDANKEGLKVDALISAVNKINHDNNLWFEGVKKGAKIVRGKGCIDSFLLARNGKLLLEEYYADSKVDKLHFTMSVTKSITSLAVGVAIDKGLIKGDQDLFIDHFPKLDRSKLAKGADKIRLADMLSMRSGIRVNASKLTRKERFASDDVVIALTRSAPIEPGKHYKYQGYDPNLLSRLIGKKTGKPMQYLIQEKLFLPMGINQFSFNAFPDNATKAAAGMHVASRDLLKVGLLVLNQGKWKGKQLVSPEWIKKSTAIHVNNGKAKYGYFWWSQYHGEGKERVLVKSARGAAGQYILMVPKYDLVVVFTSYGSKNAFHILEKFILPACRK